MVGFVSHGGHFVSTPSCNRYQHSQCTHRLKKVKDSKDLLLQEAGGGEASLVFSFYLNSISAYDSLDLYDVFSVILLNFLDRLRGINETFFVYFSYSTGLERDKFDNKTVSFEEHIKSEHNMWHYLYLIVLVRVKDPTEYTGPESYVAQMIMVSQ